MIDDLVNIQYVTQRNFAFKANNISCTQSFMKTWSNLVHIFQLKEVVAMFLMQKPLSSMALTMAAE